MGEQEPKKMTREEYRERLLKKIDQREEELRILESNYSDNAPDPKSLIKEINEVKEKIESLKDRLKESDEKFLEEK